jgi:hypothetical protein
MSEKERQKKDGRRKDKKVQAMKENRSPRKEMASIRYGAQKVSKEDDGRRRGERRS